MKYKKTFGETFEKGRCIVCGLKLDDSNSYYHYDCALTEAERNRKFRLNRKLLKKRWRISTNEL